MKHFVGIDNSHTAHSVVIIEETGQCVKQFEITNDLAGFEKLHKLLSEFSEIFIGFEITFGPLVDFLRMSKYKIYSINPLKIKRYKESYTVSGNKTDSVDSHAIANYIRSNERNLKQMVFSSEAIETLKILGVSHDRLVKERTRNINKLTTLFRQYIPLYDGLFSENAAKTLLKLVIKYPTWGDLASQTEEELKAFFKSCKYYNPKSIHRVLEKINSYSQKISPAVEAGFSCEAVSIARMLLQLQDDISILEKKMVSLVEAHRLGKVFMSLPGAGIVLGSKLLALFGDNKTKFSKARDAQTLFGTAPVNYQSGSYHRVTMRRACDRRARSILYKFAFCSINLNKWSKVYYDEHRKKGSTHSIAVRALSNKWLNILFAMWKNEINYCPLIKVPIAA